MRSMAVDTTSNSTNMCTMRVHGASPVRVKDEGMTQLNGELVYVASSLQETLSTPPTSESSWEEDCLLLHQAASAFSGVVQPWQNGQTFCSPGKHDS